MIFILNNLRFLSRLSMIFVNLVAGVGWECFLKIKIGADATVLTLGAALDSSGNRPVGVHIGDKGTFEPQIA